MKKSEPKLKIKPLNANDLDAVIAIDMATTGVSRRGYFETRLTAATDHPKDYIYVGAFQGDDLLGFAFAKLVNGEFGKLGTSASLDAIGVKPEHSHSGTGQLLLESVEKVLSDKSVQTLTSQIDWSSEGVLSFFNGAGFKLAAKEVLTRKTEPVAYRTAENDVAEKWDSEPDYSSPEGDDSDALSRDRVLVRSMSGDDLAEIVKIDKATTGLDRSDYYERKIHESLHESGVRVSLVAELDGYPVGFIMAQVDYGEFGRTSTEAVMDTIGVDPGYTGQGVGQALMSQLLANLSVLRVERLRTEISWNDVGLIAYFDAMGFAPAQRITLSRTL